ncbi:MAG: toll/interleukin-1 receptor domain-containing protein [Armatimonadetes bacterium]|nr:toll/interleukin-1 receptor domain-containing protein [Armatimonadota bacterium]
MSDPKVFISYSHDDAEWVSRFAEALRDQGVDVWLDSWQVHAGDSLREAMEAGLRGSDAVVAVLSADNARRPSVLFELGAAIGAGKRLIPILAPDLVTTTLPFPMRSRRYLSKGAPDDAAREVAEALKREAA